jgi:hypothetical protein
MEQSSIGQVSANIRELDPSILTLQISPSIMLENTNVTVSGQILPQTANENVTLQAKINNGGWTTIANVTTQANGRFKYSWVPASGGMAAVQASWLGNRQYNGATSAQASVVILPIYIAALIAALVSAVLILVLVLVKTRHRKPEPIQTTATAPPPISPP